MSANLKELEKQAQSLPAEERASLAESLLASLHTSHVAEVEAVWAVEIARRVTTYERGEATLVPAEEVFTKARQIVASRES
jgi:putative addiction module component (TIGR02574 family)